ncbi:high-affinity nicotinic acid transporter [Cryptococcus deuterogattii R265]|uniref:high-affinity nicotinic acid transporter n=1 Tax=Cryptococcus deuterogattii (strain R265) TaxID=294750 RepID=UPI001936D86B|nr:high-affinity nicotinic acid transporter [Cryptococcus deuterogattii R265]
MSAFATATTNKAEDCSSEVGMSEKDVESPEIKDVGDIEVQVASIDRAVERRMLKKQDFGLLPVLAIVYLFNALDKGNLSNAKTDGLDKDLGLVGNQYYLMITVFYIPLCLCGTPLSIAAKRFSAARVIPLMMIGFGSCSLLSACVTNFGGLFALRFLLGIFESPMLPSVVFYLSQFYTRGELARRVGVFYAASSISGAFSGLLAFGIFQIKSERLHGWQYLFLIEGAGTVTFAIFAFFWLPRSPATCWFFNEEEKKTSRMRMLRDGTNEIGEKVDFRDAFMPFINDWRYIVWALLALGLGVPLASVGNFLPQIVARLGYSTVKTNLYTVAPNIVGTCFLVLFTQSSDYFRERALHIVVPLIITMVGFIILGTIDVLSYKGVAYFACFLLCIGANTPSVLLSTWYSNNSISENKRVVLTGVMVGIANASGLISANIFRAQDEPKYIPALAASAAFGGFTALLAFSFGLYMRIENRRRNLAQGLPKSYGSKDVPTEYLGRGPKDQAFRYMF